MILSLLKINILANYSTLFLPAIILIEKLATSLFPRSTLSRCSSLTPQKGLLSFSPILHAHFFLTASTGMIFIIQVIFIAAF